MGRTSLRLGLGRNFWVRREGEMGGHTLAPGFCRHNIGHDCGGGGGRKFFSFRHDVET